MAEIVEVIPRYGACEGPNIAADGSRTYRDTYLVRTDVPVNDGNLVLGWVVAMEGDVFPSYGQAFRSDPGALVRQFAPKQNSDAATVWEIVVTYDSKTDVDDQQDKDRPPWDRPARWSWGSVTVETYPFKDLKGKLFLTTVGDQFDPALTVPVEHAVLVIEQNELSFDFLLAQELANLVNSAEYAGFPTRSLKVAFPTATEEKAEGQYFWKITYSVEIANLFRDPPVTGALKVADPWLPKLVQNRGPHYYTTNDPATRKKILAADDNKVTTGDLVNLKESGTLATAADFSDIHNIEFYTYPEDDYTARWPFNGW